MHRHDREKKIIEILEKREFISNNELMKAVNSSIATLRRDLNSLEGRGLLKRTHGGVSLADSSSENTFDNKLNLNSEAKNKIAKKAAKYINQGEIIFLDAGTTTNALIKYLDGKNLVVITNGAHHLPELAKYNFKEIIITGGSYHQVTGALTGKDTLDSLHKYRIDRAFIGANGYHKKMLSTTNSDEALIKEAIISLAKQSYILIDKSKYGIETFTNFATDKNPKIKIIGA